LEEFSHIAEKVEKLQGATSSGKEGQYYIIEIPLITGIVP
jgi:hypothetical protein